MGRRRLCTSVQDNYPAISADERSETFRAAPLMSERRFISVYWWSGVLRLWRCERVVVQQKFNMD